MPRNNADFLGSIKFHLHGRGSGDHVLQVSGPEGDVIGHMRWQSWDGVVRDISVNSDVRRRGVATALWNHAHYLADLGQVTRPVHSPVRTEDGLAWSKSLDGGSNA